jgi:RimJ/RimL family protein N-acetyltransferase
VDVPTIAGLLVTLRRFNATDVDAVADAAADPYICLMTGLEADARDEAATYVRRQARRSELDLGVSWAIADAVSGRAVGQIGIWLRAVAPDGSTGYREEAHGRAALSYWIAPPHRRRGYAAAALEAASSWGLARPDVHRLELFIEPANVGSWRAAERSGYEREGLLRSWQQLGDERRDMYVYARLP